MQRNRAWCALLILAVFLPPAPAQDYCARPLMIRPLALADDGTVVGAFGALAALEAPDGTVSTLWPGEARCVSAAGVGGWTYAGTTRQAIARVGDTLLVWPTTTYPRSVDAVDDSGNIYVSDYREGGVVYHGARARFRWNEAWGREIRGARDVAVWSNTGTIYGLPLAVPGVQSSDCWGAIDEYFYGTCYLDMNHVYYAGVPLRLQRDAAVPVVLPTDELFGEVAGASAWGAVGVAYSAVAVTWGWNFTAQQAIVWPAAGGFFTLPGYSRAYGINDMGQIIAGRAAGGYDLLTPARPGDFDCDGCVTNFDIDPFVAALLTDDPPARCDLNGDGRVDNFDITAFVNALGSP